MMMMMNVGWDVFVWGGEGSLNNSTCDHNHPRYHAVAEYVVHDSTKGHDSL